MQDIQEAVVSPKEEESHGAGADNAAGGNSASSRDLEQSISPLVQQQSPMSVSVTNSNANSAVVTPFTSVGNEEHGAGLNANGNSNSDPEGVVRVPVAKEQPTTSIDEVMDVDQEGEGEAAPGQQEEVDGTAMAAAEDKQKTRDTKMRTIQDLLDTMEDTRLELVPLLLDTVEEVKSGELPIKDIDNSCARIRVRIGKLHEYRARVETGLREIEAEFNCSTRQKQELDDRIRIKEQGLASIVDTLQSRWMDI